MIPSEKKYIFWTDFIRVISIFLVIMIHAASPLYNRWNDVSFQDWMTGNAYNSFARVSVPLLFMISGYLLLDRQETIRAFYLKRVKKVFIPLLVWSIIYLIWQNGYANYTWFNALKAIALNMLKGPAYYHLWFVYALFSIYLFVPVLRVFTRAADENEIRYFALLWLIFGPVLDHIEENYLNFHIPFDLGFFTGYIGYFYLGYVIGKMNFTWRTANLAGLTYLLVTLYTIYVTYRWSIIRGEYLDYYHNYLRLNIAVMSISVFIWLKHVGESLGARMSERSERWARRLSAATFGIYLIHAMLLVLIRRGTFGFQIAAIPSYPVIVIPLLTLLVFFAAYAIIALLQKIPFLRAIAPS